MNINNKQFYKIIVDSQLQVNKQRSRLIIYKM